MEQQYGGYLLVLQHARSINNVVKVREMSKFLQMRELFLTLNVWHLIIKIVKLFHIESKNVLFMTELHKADHPDHIV